jgi:hypothetical protein
MASPRERVRLPSWISMDINDYEVRQPPSSPPSKKVPHSHWGKRSHNFKSSPNKPCATWEERKSCRKSGQGPVAPRESQLVFLCRQQDWQAALLNLQEHPEQAEPVLRTQVHLEEEAESHFNVAFLPDYADNSPVYYETALNILCSFARFGNEAENLPFQLLQELLQVCPKQAIVSHMDTGHTALRSILRNHTCNPDILQILMGVMKQTCPSQPETFQELCVMPDRDYFRPIDHVVFAFHQGADKPFEVLKTFVQFCGEGHTNFLFPNNRNPTIDATAASPLIRLLSIGNATPLSRLSPKISSTLECSTPTTTLTTTAASKTHPSSKLLLEATRFFLQEFPFLLDQTALTTKCTPLHVALRNYGNYDQLIQCFVLKDGNHPDTHNRNKTNMPPLILKSLQQENNFGDLPIHVASSVGVPVSILKLILEGTLEATSSLSNNKSKNKHQAFNLCWTVNHAGYTPIDLEWIRHMEDGKGLFMARSFYPLEAGGIKKTFWKQDEFYRVLLQQAVQQAMDVRATNPFWRAFNSNNPQTAPRPGINNPTHTASSRTMASRRTPRTGQTPPQQASFPSGPPREPSEQPTWELLLHRIFLITQTAATGYVPKTQTDLVDCLLHAACKLSFPVAPSLPLPLLELILFMYPEQLRIPQSRSKSMEKGKCVGPEKGNLPLHFAVQPSVGPRRSTISFFSDESTQIETHQHICNEWETWVKHLLEHGPEAASTTNDVGQIPLHKVLEYQDSEQDCQTSTTATFMAPKPRTMSPPESARLNVVHSLVEAFPNSVHAMDPVSRLMPFQMAAASAHIPLEAVFYLLRRSPDAVVV